MNKALSLALAGVLALGATSAAAQTKWDLPAGYPATNFHSKNLIEFANDVRKATGGKLDITVHAGASLFKVPEIKRAVQTGQAPIGELLMSVMENEDAVYGVDVVPFLATSYADSEKLWKAARPVIEKKLGAQGLTVLYAVPWPPQGIYAKKEINTIEDMKGLKFRAYNVGTARIAELVGAQPVTIQAAELAQALATGVVNSFISSGSTGRDSKVWESLTHWYDTQAWLPNNIIFVNTAALNKLDAATKKALMDAAEAAEARGRKMSTEEAESSKAALQQNGMKIQPPSPALAAGFKKIGETLTEDWLKKAGADGKAIVDSYKKMM
ncbi:MAG TPA: TRAP transporter substrate-binding protein [Alphaproteobacteria bacterium]|nr:TRAP transporter substrate-binding protein [Alphaproteobacteria bacterium]